jgi:SAM-dependent methyltransferase
MPIQKDNYDVVWLDNCLEHVLDRLGLLEQCSLLLKKNGVLVIEVPNDFSAIQKHLLHMNKITIPFWINVPDHISYFNSHGLNKLLSAAGFTNFLTIADFPIDIYLMNPESNYINDSSKGTNCHNARIEIENLLHPISIPKVIEYYEALVDLGMGRRIISFNQLTP